MNLYVCHKFGNKGTHRTRMIRNKMKRRTGKSSSTTL